MFAILIAMGIGYWADGRFGTSPWLLFLGSAIGFGAFVLRLLRLGRQLKQACRRRTRSPAGERAGLTIDPIERTESRALARARSRPRWWLASPAFALSLGFGALLEAVNFRGLRRSAQFLFWGEIRGGGGWPASSRCASGCS